MSIEMTGKGRKSNLKGFVSFDFMSHAISSPPVDAPAMTVKRALTFNN